MLCDWYCLPSLCCGWAQNWAEELCLYYKFYYYPILSELRLRTYDELTAGGRLKTPFDTESCEVGCKWWVIVVSVVLLAFDRMPFA